MPLYNNILSSRRVDASDGAQGDTKPKNSNAGLKFLQDHLAAKRRTQQQISKKPKLTSSVHDSNQIISETNLHSSDFDWSLEEEYDPRLPNSYEILLAEFLKANKKPKQTVTKPERSTPTPSTKKIDLSLLDAIDGFDDECESLEEGNKRGTAIAPPTNLSTSAASHQDQVMASSIEDILAVQPKESSPMIESTRVILLQNMVGPGQVDDSLEAETQEECGKYGHVHRCLIYEFPKKSVPDEEAVRIFVEFDNVDSAVRAANDLNGRYFGGRVVKATFYNVDKFSRYELGQPVEIK